MRTCPMFDTQEGDSTFHIAFEPFDVGTFFFMTRLESVFGLNCRPHVYRGYEIHAYTTTFGS